MYLKRNIDLNRALIYGEDQWDGFYTMTTLD